MKPYQKLTLKALVLFFLTFDVFFVSAQTSDEKDRELNEKYWIYRDRFRKRFVNIGKLDGQSLPFVHIIEGVFVPYLAKDLLSRTDLTDSEKTKSFQGIIKPGEMGIELGHYIAILATEHRLLVWSIFNK